MSSAPLRVFLNAEEDRTLWELSKAEKIDGRTKERAEIIRLSSKGWKVKKIAEYMRCAEETVRRTINKWKKQGLGGLYTKKRSGRKRKWEEEDIKIVEEKLKKDQRCYNSKQLCNLLKKERKIELSERQMRRILKKKLYMEKNKNLIKRQAR